MFTTQNLLVALRKNVEELYSHQVQIKIEQQPNEADKQAFAKERERCRNSLHALEKHDLENVLLQMKQVERELSQAVTELDRELHNVNNIVRVLSSIRNISSLLSRVMTFF